MRQKDARQLIIIGWNGIKINGNWIFNGEPNYMKKHIKDIMNWYTYDAESIKLIIILVNIFSVTYTNKIEIFDECEQEKWTKSI